MRDFGLGTRSMADSTPRSKTVLAASFENTVLMPICPLKRVVDMGKSTKT